MKLKIINKVNFIKCFVAGDVNKRKSVNSYVWLSKI